VSFGITRRHWRLVSRSLLPETRTQGFEK